MMSEITQAGSVKYRNERNARILMSAALDHLKTRNKKCKNDADDRRGNYVSQNPPNPRKRLAKIGTRFVWIECPAALWTTAGIARLIELCVTFSAIHQAS